MPSHADRLREEYDRRNRQLEALYETAGELTALRDVDRLLTTIVRRSRLLLRSDVAYLMLLDEDREEIYMRAVEGIQTQEFLEIRLKVGEGIAGLVASSGVPLWTSDYSHDEHLAMRIDATVRRESLKAIAGVPLSSAGRSAGVLLVADRQSRDFTRDEVTALASLGHHAAIALNNAALFQEAQDAVDRWKDASARVEQQNQALQRAAEVHEQLIELLLHGASVSEVAEAVASIVGGEVVLLDPGGIPLTASQDVHHLDPDDLEAAFMAAGRAHLLPRPGTTTRVVAVQAGPRRLAALLHRGELITPAEVRALERAAMVTATLLLDRRAQDDARVRAMGQVLDELLVDSEPDVARIRRRAQIAGVALPSGPYVVAVALAPVDAAGNVDLDAVAALATRESWLTRVEGRQATLLVDGSDATLTARTLAERLADVVGEPITVGAAGPTTHLVGLPALFQRAHTCAKVLETTGQRGRGASTEDLGLYALLLSDVGRERIEDFVAETIGAVQRWDREGTGHLMTTLEQYFEEGGQTGRLAEALYVHVNTLYQRLDRLDRLLGPGWRRGEQALQVHLAVRLAGLLQGHVERSLHGHM